jgi:hypothetical protein
VELGKTRRVPETKCLSCGTSLDAATPADFDGEPYSGAITVCIKCGHIMALDDNLKLRELTKDEAFAVAGDARILAIQRARKALAAEEK